MTLDELNNHERSLLLPNLEESKDHPGAVFGTCFICCSDDVRVQQLPQDVNRAYLYCDECVSGCKGWILNGGSADTPHYPTRLLPGDGVVAAGDLACCGATEEEVRGYQRNIIQQAVPSLRRCPHCGHLSRKAP